MCDEVKLSLFDRFLKEVSYDLSISNVEILSPEVVRYTSDRTGCEATMSYARYLAITTLVEGLTKRYIGPTIGSSVSNDDRHQNAVLEFLEDNQRCLDFNSSSFPSELSVFNTTVLGEVKELLSSVLDGLNGSCLNLSNVASKMRAGPGSSSDFKSSLKGDFSAYAKFAEGPMTFSSPDVAGVYKACILTTRLTSVVEAVRYSLYGQLDSYHTNAHFLSVPKTNSKNRGICTQPSGNMLLQLSTHQILSDVLRHSFDCDLSTQQESNRMLAYLGSCGKRSMEKESWEFCTLDLSRASNFPWLLVQTLFPQLWVQWLDMIRSPSMKIEGADIPKHMCSTMGNGFTFSLMTLLLSSIVKVLYSLANLPEFDVHPIYGRMKTWAVYGDDIIVDKRVFNALCGVLKAFGFLLNEKKTFSTGLFRESCGGDFYNGSPVRPVFLETLETQADIYSLINRLTLWGVQHSVDLPRGLSCLRSQLKSVIKIPNWEDVSSGLHVPFTLCDQKPTGVPLSIEKVLNVGNLPYRALVAVPKKRTLYQEFSRTVLYSDISSRTLLSYDCVVEVKVYSQNLPGMLLCMLEGSVRNGQYGLRPCGETVYREVWKIAPTWGDPTLFTGTATPVRWSAGLAVYRLWEEYVKRNTAKVFRPLALTL